ncbi:protein of unknown function [Burkholderia multivorans]
MRRARVGGPGGKAAMGANAGKLAVNCKVFDRIAG